MFPFLAVVHSLPWWILRSAPKQKLRNQNFVTSSKFRYVIKISLIHQNFFMPSKLRYVINMTLRQQNDTTSKKILYAYKITIFSFTFVKQKFEKAI
jgi:hypothetical protein